MGATATYARIAARRRAMAEGSNKMEASPSPVVVTWYARLSGYGGKPTQEVYAVPAQSVRFDDDTEPYYSCYASIAPYDGECDGVPCESIVYYDYLYRRCAPIGRDKAYELDADLVRYVDSELARAQPSEHAVRA